MVTVALPSPLAIARGSAAVTKAVAGIKGSESLSHDLRDRSATTKDSDPLIVSKNRRDATCE